MSLDDRVVMVKGRPMFGCNSLNDELRKTPVVLPCTKAKREDSACCEGCDHLPDEVQ